ncbi:MAG TPA: PAS domain-containing protein [Pseudogracilibacillus sp.]|nr:PAS domain-containing protein [Pseudogracilibacillus sp.]
MLTSMHFHVDKIKMVKNHLLQYCEGLSTKELETLRLQYNEYPKVPLLLLLHHLYEDMKSRNEQAKLAQFMKDILDHEQEEGIKTLETNHPLKVLQKENEQFVEKIIELDTMLQTGDKIETSAHKQMIYTIYSLGQLYNHFHVKEKLLFPLMERYGHQMFTRMMWRQDDQIRGLYNGAKHMIETLREKPFENVILTFDSFVQAFQRMIEVENLFLFPIVYELFNEKEWERVAAESSAYGYEIVYKPDNKSEKGDKHDTGKNNKKISDQSREKNSTYENQKSGWKTEQFQLGGGFLTLEEANLILNNLPVEITFVDRNSIFKYFNERTKAEDMMLIRTPLSIGRNVADCHPPKSLQKVMTLVRDLKTKKRTSESMWFKKGDAYVHITYKGLFNEEDEFIGILEYVQDISPFLELPKEVKRELSPLED